MSRMAECTVTMRWLALGVVAIWLSACAAQPLSIAHRWVEVHGSKLYVETSGRGAPIVFLHGGLHHFDNTFALQRDDFAATRTVIGIDQRGHGHSPDDARPFSYKTMADDTAAVIQQMGVGPVDVVGHSDAGNVGLILARAYPQLVRRLVISGANMRPALPPAEWQRRSGWSSKELDEFLPKLEQQIPPAFRRDHESVSPEGAEHWNAFLEKSYRLWLTPRSSMRGI